LDEADRMVDIGFIKDIKFFISLMPPVRQSLFFSATISDKVREILQTFVRNPVTVSVKKQETAESIEQEVIRIKHGEDKVDKLHDLLRLPEFEKVLIFGRTKWGVQKLTDELVRRGFRAGAIHGNKKQNQRQRVLDEFKNNEIQILLATDVASRGLDIPDVSHVINYDMPESYEVYVHRIGRTGRADKKGIALTFIEGV
jgi:ATP-dependent RNA helicase RhlE